MSTRILVIDDEKIVRRSLNRILTQEGYEVDAAENGSEGKEYLKHVYYPIVLLDLKLPDIGGFELLKKIKAEHPDTVVIMITGYATVASAVEAMKLGAYDYLSKPFSPDEIKAVIKRAVEKIDLTMENMYLKSALDWTFQENQIIGKSDGMKRVMSLVSRVAPTDSTVLITGESGTGKELVAKSIHRSGNRADKPFVPVDCGSLVESLFESELFGHVKGSFTGAVSTKHGRFELANGGTIFLDEIGNLSINTQSKLLRALQEREITRVGGTRSFKIDVRIICAANQELMKKVKEGKFRDDLYFRISVVPIFIPPLRERKEDIPLLVDYAVRKYAEKRKKEIKGISDKAMRMLVQYDWPGNVRELENVIERAVVLSTGDRLESEDLFYPTSTGMDQKWISEESLSLEDAEREHIEKVMTLTSGNKTEAAGLLGIDRKTLRTKLNKYGIE